MKPDVKKILIATAATGAVIAIGRYVVNQIRLAQKWDYEVTGFEVKSFNPVSFAFKFAIINKSSIKTEIKDIDITVFTDNKVLLGKINKRGPIIIDPDGKSPMDVLITIDPKNLQKNLIAILQTVGKKMDIPMDFVGQAKVFTGFFWLKVPIMFSTSGKQLMELYRETYK